MPEAPRGYVSKAKWLAWLDELNTFLAERQEQQREECVVLENNFSKTPAAPGARR